MASYYEEMMKTKSYLPFNMGGKLTEAIIAKAKRELGETEEVKAKTIPQLRQMVLNEPNLDCPTDDAYLLQFLRPRKFNVKKAFSNLKNYFDVKLKNDDLYGSLNYETMKKANDLKMLFILPYRDEDGCAVVVFRMKKWDVDFTNIAEGVTFLTVILLMCVQEPTTQICGIRILFDGEGASWKQIKCLSLRYAILMVKALKNCLPIRFKGYHIYNESPIFYYALSLFRLFNNEKIRSRIYLHGDSQMSLNKFLPKAILPTEHYGGDNPNDVPTWSATEIEKFFETCRQLLTYGYRK